MKQVWRIIGWALALFSVEACVPPVILFRPAAGLGLAALLCHGPGLWLALFLGSLGGGLWNHHTIWSSLAEASVDTAQALLVLALMRRFLGPFPLSRRDDLLRFSFLYAPIGALPGGLATMVLWSGARTADGTFLGQALLEALARWEGLALVAPMMLCLVARHPPWNRRRNSVLLPTLVAVGMIFFGRSLIQRQFEHTARLSLEMRADIVAAALERRADACRAAVEIAAARFGAGGKSSRDELADLRPQPRQLIWLPRDSRREEPARLQTVLEQVRRTGQVAATLDRELDLVVAVPVNSARPGTLIGIFSLRGLVKEQAGSRSFLRLYLRQPSGRELTMATYGSIPANALPGVSRVGRLAGQHWGLELVGAPAPGSRPRAGMLAGLVAPACLQFFLILLDDRRAQIEELTARVLAADRAKGLFLANISHEIRTPINGILGLTRLMLSSDVSEAHREQLGHVVSSARTLRDTLGAILDVSRIEAGELRLVPSSQDLTDLLEQAVRTVVLSAEEKGIDVLLAMDPELPSQVSIDGTRLCQVLTNLLSNAVKFTEQGEVRLEVRLLPSAGQSCRLRFSVQDTGPGIPRDLQRQIFLPFAQSQTEAARTRGAGLGLSISASLVKLMGGRLEVDSSPGRGSAFFFQVECPALAPPDLEFPPTLVPASIPVLVDLDTPGAASVLEQLIDYWGFPRCDCPDQAELVICAESGLGNSGRGPTVVVLAASRLLVLYDRCRQQGAVPLPTPVTPRRLHQALIEALLDTPVSLPQALPRSYDGCKALVVDDNKTNRLLASLLLERLGLEVDQAGDGCEAVEALRRARYDLVLMDLSMPEKDGFTAAERIRESGCRVPIIGCSAYDLDSHRQRAMACGMNAFLPKPLLEADLRQRLEETLAPATPSFDLDVLLCATDQDQQAARTLAATLLEELPVLKQRLVDAGTPQEMESAAHALAGALHVFDATRLTDALGHLRSLACSDPNREKALARVLEEAERLQQHLSAFCSQPED